MIEKKFIEKFQEISDSLDKQACEAALSYASSDDVMYREKYLAIMSVKRQLDQFARELPEWCKLIQEEAVKGTAVKAVQLARNQKYIGCAEKWGLIDALISDIESGKIKV